eukprot:6148620-Pleurochrysis_carterae.AAC.3
MSVQMQLQRSINLQAACCSSRDKLRDRWLYSIRLTQTHHGRCIPFKVEARPFSLRQTDGGLPGVLSTP